MNRRCKNYRVKAATVKWPWTHLGSESCLGSWREREGEEGLGWKLKKSREEHKMKRKGTRRNLSEPAKFLRALYILTICRQG